MKILRQAIGLLMVAILSTACGKNLQSNKELVFYADRVEAIEEPFHGKSIKGLRIVGASFQEKLAAELRTKDAFLVEFIPQFVDESTEYKREMFLPFSGIAEVKIIDQFGKSTAKVGFLRVSSRAFLKKEP